MNLKHLLFPTAPKTVEVVVTRNTFAAGRELLAGQTVELPERQALELVNSGAAYDPAAEDAASQRAAALNALLPPPVEPRPIPESWQNLPRCFADWWDLNERAFALIERRNKIWDVLLPTLRGYLMDQDMRSIASLPDAQMRANLVAATATAIQIGPIPEEHHRKEAFLRDAYQRSEKAVEDFFDMNREALAVVNFRCSQHTLGIHGKLCRSIRDLHALGLEIFSARVAALGLAEVKIAELYRGSSDFLKYGTITEPALENLRLAYYDESVGAAHFINRPPPVMVAMIESYGRTSAEVERLTAEAKKELARTKKAAA